MDLKKMSDLSELYTTFSQLLHPDKSRFDNVSFQNGEGYIQQPAEVVEKLSDKICQYLSHNFTGYDHIFNKRPVNRQGIIGRLIDDSSGNPHMKIIANMWSKLSRIDGDYKEWGQFYFLVNPKERKEICLNKYFRDKTIDSIIN